MLPIANLIVLINTTFLYGYEGFILSAVFLLMYLLKRKKTNTLIANILVLEKKIEHLMKGLDSEDKSEEEKIAFKTKLLLDKIEDLESRDLGKKIALKKAEESNFLKNAFFVNISHEMRTPLNGIIGFSNLLMTEAESQEKQELVKFAKVIAESSDRLLSLMENIIDLSRIDTNDYELKIIPFEVNAIIATCIEKNANKANKKNLILEYRGKQKYQILGDKTAFERSINLILDNAINYTPSGIISVSLHVHTETNKLRILISDTGVGIDKSFLSNIFAAYRRKNTGYSRLQQGAGLGLPLAQKLISLMGGDIQIESEKGKGTQVSLVFPLSENSNTIHDLVIDNSKKQITNHPTKKIPANFFIVEDDKMNCLLFEQMLSKYTHVQIATDGDDAINQLNKAMKNGLTFDAILLDINLPAPWDGLMLLKEFKKKWPILNKVPFIAQTAYAVAGDKEKFLAAGFDDYISKPIDKKELITIIENNIRKFKV